MKCKKYKQLIYLYKTGELSKREQKLLHLHLKKCTDCKILFNELLDSSKIIDEIKNSKPKLSQEKKLAESIMQKIHNIEDKTKSTAIRHSWNRLIGWFYFPRIKYAMVSIVMVLIGIFIFQQSVILQKLSVLEEKNEKEVFHKKTITKPFESYKIINTPGIIDRLKTSELEKELMLIDKKELETFLESYKDLKNEHDILIEYIQEKLSKNQEKLSKKDIEKLLKNLSKNKKTIELIKEL